MTARTYPPFAITRTRAGWPVPSTPDPDGGVMYVATDGSLHYVSPSGTDTQIAPA